MIPLRLRAMVCSPSIGEARSWNAYHFRDLIKAILQSPLWRKRRSLTRPGSVVLIGLFSMAGMIVDMIAARCVIVVLLPCSMDVHVAVGMLMGVLVQMFMLCATVAMGMRVEMLVKMTVLVLMLQIADGVAAPLSIGES